MDTGFPPAQWLLRTFPCPRKQHPVRNTLPTALLLELHPVCLTPAQSPLKMPSPCPCPQRTHFQAEGATSVLTACIGCQYPCDHAFHNCTKHRADLAVLMWVVGQENSREQQLRKIGDFWLSRFYF